MTEELGTCLGWGVPFMVAMSKPADVDVLLRGPLWLR